MSTNKKGKIIYQGPTPFWGGLGQREKKAREKNVKIEGKWYKNRGKMINIISDVIEKYINIEKNEIEVNYKIMKCINIIIHKKKSILKLHTIVFRSWERGSTEGMMTHLLRGGVEEEC